MNTRTSYEALQPLGLRGFMRFVHLFSESTVFRFVRRFTALHPVLAALFAVTVFTVFIGEMLDFYMFL